MSVKLFLRAWGRLGLIQIAAMIAVWLGTYYPGLDILLGLVYVGVIFWELLGLWRSDDWSSGTLLVLLVIWQLPLVASALMLNAGYYDGSSIYYWAFLQQIWLTPFLPLLAGFWPDIFTMGPAAAICCLLIFILTGIVSRYLKLLTEPSL